jgi:hypothetical protein
MDSDDSATEDLMAQMGFSSFGGPQKKKRRYNPRADAGQDVPPSGTGANSTALGRPAANVDEIDLEDEGENPTTEDGNPRPVTQAQVRPASLPQRPAPFTSGGGAESRVWYEGYYDHLSNENPWDRLEKAKGLEAKGSWVPRPGP